MVTPVLIGITSAISLYALWFRPTILDWGMLRPYRVSTRNTWYEVFTSGFLHGSMTHLLVNMFVLLVFGLTVEQNIGLAHMVGLYISGILVSALPSLWKHSHNPSYATLGASGAVEAVLFIFIFMFPMQDIYLFFIPVGIPAWIFGLLFLIYSLAASKNGGKINHEAHIAGSLWGLIYPLLFIPRSLDHLITLLGFY